MSDEFRGITPHLTVPDTDAAVGFYRAAFGADELLRNADADGRVFHCELLINGGRLLLHDDLGGARAAPSDVAPTDGTPTDGTPTDMASGETSRDGAPERFGGSPVVLHLDVADVDATFAAAIAAGASVDQEPEDTFWGDRYAQLTDPSGHRWSLGTRKQELSVAEHEARADAWSARHRGSSDA